MEALPAGDTKSALAEFGPLLDELTRDAEQEFSVLVWSANLLRAAELDGGFGGETR
jgi:hypothetical protein